MIDLHDTIIVASRMGYGPEEETARADLRLITPTIRKVSKVNTTKIFKDLLKMAKAKTASRSSVDYRPPHAMPTTASPAKKGKKSPAKPILKKKQGTMPAKKTVKTKGEKGLV